MPDLSFVPPASIFDSIRVVSVCENLSGWGKEGDGDGEEVKDEVGVG